MALSQPAQSSAIGSAAGVLHAYGAVSVKYGTSCDPSHAPLGPRAGSSNGARREQPASSTASTQPSPRTGAPSVYRESPETAAAAGASHCRKAVRFPTFSSARRWSRTSDSSCELSALHVGKGSERKAPRDSELSVCTHRSPSRSVTSDQPRAAAVCGIFARASRSSRSWQHAQRRVRPAPPAQRRAVGSRSNPASNIPPSSMKVHPRHMLEVSQLAAAPRVARARRCVVGGCRRFPRKVGGGGSEESEQDKALRANGPILPGKGSPPSRIPGRSAVLQRRRMLRAPGGLVRRFPLSSHAVKAGHMESVVVVGARAVSRPF